MEIQFGFTVFFQLFESPTRYGSPVLANGSDNVKMPVCVCDNGLSFKTIYPEGGSSRRSQRSQTPSGPSGPVSPTQ